MGGRDGQTDIFFVHIFTGVDYYMNTFSLVQAFLSQVEPFAVSLFSRVQTGEVLERHITTHPAVLGVQDIPVVPQPVAV